MGGQDPSQRFRSRDIATAVLALPSQQRPHGFKMALQHLEENGEVCPANWKKGDEAMKPTAAGVASYLKKHS